ncbi:BolA family transcriptional regulator [Permianibacter sp. IMCC34836]|uniref:BolA family protein n=1 Tax=Permianibacter fluminis TaxID=2738515 RepID=UPI001555FE8B|nr:BolA family protein [Permianibacter fluminis]NQD37089.1 BolA family transcriptional regulator [Permianibacter fluminis]
MIDNRARLIEIEQRLRAALAPTEFELLDESHLHAGHAGALTGKGHFAVRIVSEQFRGKLPLARHRLVYAALAELMETDIHALRIDAQAP